MLFVAATAFNINEGVALTPLMVLYLLFFVTAAGVIVIAVDPGDPDVMSRPPRDPKLPITNRARGHAVAPLRRGAVRRRARAARRSGPDEPSTDAPSVVDDDDVRRHGPRHGLQRADQPPRPGQRARARRSSRRSRSRSFPLALRRPRDRARRACSSGAAHPSADRAASGSPASASRCCCRSSIEASKWMRRRRRTCPPPAVAGRRPAGVDRTGRRRAAGGDRDR